MVPPETPSFVKRGTTAIGIFSCNRPDYLRKVLDSFKLNENLEAYDFYLFQDGAINPWSRREVATQEAVEACLTHWEKAALPHKQQLVRATNVGIAINQFEAKVLLFEELGYERCMFFEDDLLLGSTYLRTLQLMLDRFEGEKHVGAVMCHGEIPHRYFPREQRWYLGRVTSAVNIGFDHLWGWGTWRDRWERIKPYVRQYMDLVEKCDYRFRSKPDILAFYEKEKCAIKNICQDFSFYFGMFKSEMFPVNTFIHRGKYIGEVGEHMTPEVYHRNGHDKVVLPDPNLDRRLTTFTGYDPKAFLAHFRFIYELKDRPLTARELAAEAAYPKPGLTMTIQRYRTWSRHWRTLKGLVGRGKRSEDTNLSRG